MADDTQDPLDIPAPLAGDRRGGGDVDALPPPPRLLQKHTAPDHVTPSGSSGYIPASATPDTPSSNAYLAASPSLPPAPEEADPGQEAGEIELAGVAPKVEGYVLADGCVNPWEQLEEEGAKAYAAFCVYRDMGYERSTSAVARELGKHVALMQRWSTLYSWVDRTRRYQLYLDRARRGRAEDQRLGMLDRHRGTAERVVELVDLWVESKLAQARRGGPDAKVDIPDSQIAALLRVAAVVERQSLGLPADQTASVAISEHRHRHTVEIPGLGPAGDGRDEGAGLSPVKDWVAKLRERADELGIGQPPAPLELEADPGHAGTQTVEASYQHVDSVDRIEVDAVARELGIGDGLDEGEA